ncbi:MAG: ArsR/SmtB family transcription factor [Bacillota bacterium]
MVKKRSAAGQQGSYRLDIIWSPAIELVTSLQVYIDRTLHKTTELGPGWVRSVSKALGPEFKGLLEDARNSYPLSLLPWHAREDADIGEFFEWLAALTPGEIYELMAADLPSSAPPMPKDISASRDRGLAVLRAWNEGYFRHFDKSILAGLRSDAQAKRAMLSRLKPEEVFEEATGGAALQPSPSIKRVVLSPQYHARPWNLHDRLAWGPIYQYPADVLRVQAGEPSPTLLRLTRALADESRLRILRHLSHGPRTFTEITKFSELAKSTVHYHMMLLRAAGLVRVHVSDDAPDRYSLRPGALERLGDRLAGFMKE